MKSDQELMVEAVDLMLEGRSVLIMPENRELRFKGFELAVAELSRRGVLVREDPPWTLRAQSGAGLIRWVSPGTEVLIEESVRYDSFLHHGVRRSPEDEAAWKRDRARKAIKAATPGQPVVVMASEDTLAETLALFRAELKEAGTHWVENSHPRAFILDNGGRIHFLAGRRNRPQPPEMPLMSYSFLPFSVSPWPDLNLPGSSVMKALFSPSRKPPVEAAGRDDEPVEAAMSPETTDLNSWSEDEIERETEYGDHMVSGASAAELATIDLALIDFHIQPPTGYPIRPYFVPQLLAALRHHSELLTVKDSLVESLLTLVQELDDQATDFWLVRVPPHDAPL